MRPLKQLVAIDWNFVEGKGAHEDIPASYDCVLHDVLWSELVGKADPARKAALARKFGEWLKRNAHRVWVGKYWGEVSSLQQSPTSFRRIRSRDVLQMPLTNDLRAFAGGPSPDWSHLLQVGLSDRGVREHEAQREGFLRLCDAYKAAIAQRPGRLSEKVPMTDEQMTAVMQKDSVVTEFVIRQCGPRFKKPGWRALLTRFPDRVAAARWARIIAYYAILRARGKTREFGNNWDDAQYAFLATYTGHIATRDLGLIKLCETIAPGVRVVSKMQPL